MHHRRGNLHARLLCGAAFIGLALAGAASAEEAVKFNIKPQTLTSALNEFGMQSRSAVLFRADVANAKMSQGIVSEAEPEAALAEMLAGTGLTYRREGDAFVIVQAGEGGSGPQGGSAADGNAVEALIVTAQKREQAIQDVPIAITAFTMEALDAQKIEGGFDLLKGVPNVSFSKTNFSGYNFQIRGIGTQAVSATTDPAVAVSFNNTTLIVNRLFEQEYVDIERVEVLRGPQGTLYGRNATSGVINVISAKPRMGDFFGEMKLEAGNFNARRVRGHVNVPLGDEFAVRAAFASTKRDGYGYNEYDGSDVDDRNLWTGRVTLGWEPTDYFRANLLWERFSEDDRRVRTSKQLCHRDTGPDEPVVLASGAVPDPTTFFYSALSQGCEAGSLYEKEAFGTPNGASLPYVSALYWGPYYASGSLGPLAGANNGFGLGGNPFHGNPDVCTALSTGGGGGYALLPVDVCNPDIYRGLMQSRDLRTISSQLEPQYRADANIFELSMDLDLTDSLTLTSQTVYSDDEYYATQDYNRFQAFPIWSDSAAACGVVTAKYTTCTDDNRGEFAGGFYADLSPRPADSTAPITAGGVVCDPQLGCSDTLLIQDLSRSSSKQFNQEFRVVSNYDTGWNFSLGTNFTKFETRNDYFVFANAFTHLLNFFPFQYHNSTCVLSSSPEAVEARAFDGQFCRYVDPNPLESINGEGHNYFRSDNPYKLTSAAIFGELYWELTPTVQLTAGMRLTWDRKVFTPIASQLLLGDYRHVVSEEGAGPEECTEFRTTCPLAGTGINGRGSPPSPDIVQDWREPTGRLVLDWKPVLPFTDDTMIYGSLSRGYKGGGANPPSVAPPSKFFFDRASGGTPEVFEPEYVNAYEIGTKNTLLDGALVLNGAAFFYDYEAYQVSKIVDRRAVNENFDAKVWGLELESVFSPVRNLRFNAAIGYLQTEIAEGEQSIDLMDRTDGGNRFFANPEGDVPEGFDEWIVIQPWITAASNCIVPRVLIESNNGNFLNAFCPTGNVAGAGTAALGTNYIDENGVLSVVYYDPLVDAPNGGAGFFKDLSGNELPNAPHWTVSLGAQYTMMLPGGWDATARVDYYWQDESYARVYNMPDYDRLQAWTNTNFSLWFENPAWGVMAEVYVKNAFDETPITGAFLNSDDSGLTTNVFTLDPRLIGVSVTKEF